MLHMLTIYCLLLEHRNFLFQLRVQHTQYYMDHLAYSFVIEFVFHYRILQNKNSMLHMLTIDLVTLAFHKFLFPMQVQYMEYCKDHR